MEEAFHFADSLVGPDTLGDEGEIGRRLTFGEILSNEQLTALQSDDDHGLIQANDQLLAVEFSTPASFGINLAAASYTQAGGNVFRSGILDQCTEFAFGRALEKRLINPNIGVGSRIRGNAGLWDDQSGS